MKAQAGKAGYPRFKPFGRYDSFTYPQSGFNLKHNQLILSHLDKINIEKHRKLEGEIKTCSIIIKNRKFYVCFSCEIEAQTKLDTKLISLDKQIGIDANTSQDISLFLTLMRKNLTLISIKRLKKY